MTNFFLPEDFLAPQEAHLQIGMIQTFTFPLDKNAEPMFPMSEEGLHLWDRFFAPHLSGAPKGLFCSCKLVYLHYYDGPHS